MKIQWKALIPSLLIPLAVGGLSALLTMGGMEQFGKLKQPPLSPPDWLFPVAWTILFLLMGIASYLILLSDNEKKPIALAVYAVQLAVNFVWPVLFFNLGNYLGAFLWLIFLWALILAMIYLFWKIQKWAAVLLVPYVLWVTFAGYLNLGIYLLNH